MRVGEEVRAMLWSQPLACPCAAQPVIAGGAQQWRCACCRAPLNRDVVPPLRWVYGDDRLARGSGLHVGVEGVACNHDFLLPEDGADFRFLAGQYTMEGETY